MADLATDVYNSRNLLSEFICFLEHVLWRNTHVYLSKHKADLATDVCDSHNFGPRGDTAITW